MSNQSTPQAQTTEDSPDFAQPVVSTPGAPLPGVFGLLKSPLFFAVTAAVAVITAATWFVSRNVMLSGLAGAALELLAVVVVWQYLLLSSRLENMAHRVADLYRQGEATGNAVQASRSAHGYTHRMLTEVSSDQSRSLQSIEELKKVSGLFYEQLKRLSEDAKAGQSELKGFLESSLILNTQSALRGLQESLAAIETALPQLTDQTELRKRLEALEAELPKLTDQSELRQSLAALQAELPGLTDQSELRQSLAALHEGLPKLTDQSELRKSLLALEAELPRLTDQSALLKGLSAIDEHLATIATQESNVKQALEVATALDRLNLEVRKQLAKLRQELGMS